jgi:DNA adenine methylase
MNIQKPFLKWVGGKTQIINDIIDKIPKEMENYHEPFLGGGSVLLAVLSLKNNGLIKINGKIYAYDVNKSLIDLYKCVKDDVEKLCKYIVYYLGEYDKCDGKMINRKPKSIEEAKTSKESYYYWMRAKYNQEKNIIKKSAFFWILNKTCFRGMYREGPNGFNVPFGHYKNSPQLDKSEFRDISNLIKDVEFRCVDFEDAFGNILEKDFVYLDPPYAPVDSKSFVGYVKNGFDLDKHLLLFELIKKLDKVMFMMSNAKVKLVMDNFEGYKIDEILCRRAINAKKPDSKAMEVIITNNI